MEENICYKIGKSFIKIKIPKTEKLQVSNTIIGTKKALDYD